MADSDDKIIKKAAQIILGSNAVSRFTKTPINFTYPNAFTMMLRHIYGNLPPVTPTESSGAYYNDPGSHIDISAYSRNPDYQDIAKTIHHEDIHALLEKAGFKYPEANVDWDTYKAAYAKALGMRAGDTKKEIPAYVGAYNPSELPGFTEEDRQVYLSNLYKTMHPQLAQTLQRIVQSYNMSQNPPFVQQQQPPQPQQ